MNNNFNSSVMRILIVNDDGIHAHGIKALERIANSISPDVWVVAPDKCYSGKGFSVSFDSPFRIQEMSPRKFAVTGTPADCVFAALGEIMQDKKPDLILSGINHGSNCADYLGLSGTVGAAFAAASQDIKAIAVSQECVKSSAITKFPLVDHFLPKIIKKLMQVNWIERTCMNINFPEAQIGNIAGVKIARQGNLDITWNVHKKLDPVNDAYYWLHATAKDVSKHPDSDVTIISANNYITITPIICRHEHEQSFKYLEELFSSNV